MYYILYNPDSRKKKVIKASNKLFNMYNKLVDCYKINLYDLNNQEAAFLSECRSDDIIFLCGGDGTIDVFLNKIKNVEFKCKLYVCPCGSGNDLSRDFKDKIFDITKFAHDLPTVSINGNQKDVFINGVGMGVDAAVCRTKAQYKFANIKKSYFKIALESIKSFRTYSLDITIDDQNYHFDDTWFFVINHGRFMGGGMKVCPQARHDDGLLDICLVHGLNKRKLFMIFPLIYLGWHIFFKKYVFYTQGKNISVKPDGCHSLQRDGEVFDGILEMKVEAC